MFESKHLNTCDSIEAILAATFEEKPLEAYFWDQSDVPSPWNTYWSDTAQEDGGLDIIDPGLGQHWTKYRGVDFGLFTNCDTYEACYCEEHYCVEA